DHARIEEGVKAVLTAGATIAFGRLRYPVTGGAGPRRAGRGQEGLTYIGAATEVPPHPGPAAVATGAWTRHARAATAGLKTTSYADNVIALAAAKAKGATEAIFGNTRGELCEATGSNIFVVVDGVVLTPSLESGPLAGITRELTI